MSIPTADEKPTALSKAIDARGRAYMIVDVSHLGLTREGDKPVAKIAFRVNVKGEEDRAIVDAWRYVDGLAKGTGAATDEDLTRESKLSHVLWNACREVDEGGSIGVSGVFPSPGWMRANLTGDEQAALLNIYNDVRFRKSPYPYEFTDDEAERIATLCADGADTEIPTAMLAGMPREIVAQYLIVTACKLRKARTELLAAQMMGGEDEPGDDGPGEELSQ